MCASSIRKVKSLNPSFETADAGFIASLNVENFEEIALRLFQYQYRANALYGAYVDALRIAPHRVKSVEQIPFLPISFFKTHRVVTGSWQDANLLFESSGTTGEVPSRHWVKDEGLYEASLLDGFRQFYGDPAEWVFLGLLPSYLERKTASLVHMAKVLMQYSDRPECGFYLDDLATLKQTIETLEARGQKALLLGVTFALLDFAEETTFNLRHTVVMETGGMKGRRTEWTRGQVHDFLKSRWGLAEVHSEYGMTELLSQAYAMADGIFKPAHTMRVLVRDVNDPLETQRQGSGVLNVIDLANVHSCAFIATEDLGRVYADGSFEVLGRMDQSALRGCSLMTA